MVILGQHTDCSLETEPARGQRGPQTQPQRTSCLTFWDQSWMYVKTDMLRDGVARMRGRVDG
jgi:hypothetical protein